MVFPEGPKVDAIVGVCRYCRAPVRASDVAAGHVVVSLSTPEGGKLYAHVDAACLKEPTA